MRRLIVSLSCVFCLSCGNQPVESEPQQVLHDKVLEIHDEAMILMGPIYAKIKDIRYIKDSTEINQDSAAQNLIHELVESEEAMMDWMAEWKTPALDSASESTMSYLKTEETKITAIKQLMSRSIHRADSFLNETQAQI